MAAVCIIRQVRPTKAKANVNNGTLNASVKVTLAQLAFGPFQDVLLTLFAEDLLIGC